GTNPNWTTYYNHTHPHTTPLPTYPFQHHHYWPRETATRSHGDSSGHPLLTSVVQLADRDEFVLGGRLSLASQPWLGDHAVMGKVLFPATAFVELLLHAAQLTGLEGFDELTLEGPLVLPETGAVQIQLAVAAPDDAGRRGVTVHSRLDGDDSEWHRNATALLGTGHVTGQALTVWPPSDAVEVALDGIYAEFAAAGLDYGPFFQGLRSAWKAGEDVFVEVRLPDGASMHADGFGLHPGLLDSVLHGVGAGRVFGEDGRARLPFSWHGVTLHASGSPVLRAQLSPAGTDAVSLHIADAAGSPVATVERLVMREVSRDQIAGAAPRSLYELNWLPLATTAEPDGLVLADHGAADQERATHVVLRAEHGQAPDAAAAFTASATMLEHLRAWSSEQTLVVVTTNAVACGGSSPAPSGAAIWGLTRAAQAELPGRLVIVDVDGDERSWSALPDALASGEGQIALRRGEAHVPRLVPVTGTQESPSWANATVLLTGASGALGTIIARHLVLEHGVRDLRLLSRNGDAMVPTDADGLVTQLACDLTDPDQIAKAVATIPTEVPLVVVHCAGKLDDVTLSGQTRERLQRTFTPKATAAWLLHSLTTHHNVTAFVMFSSAAATLGSPGQANYAAANAYLDALTHHRRASGRPGISLAWGMWDAGMAGTRGTTDRDRLAGTGIELIDEADGTALFDAALTAGGPFVAPLPLNKAALQRRAAEQPLPSVMRNLVRSRARASATTSVSLAEVLWGLPPQERRDRLTDVIRSRMAAVMGHGSAEAISMDRPFTDLGFDSLMAVEFRGALDTATGLRLPATLVFDHPTPAALYEHLSSRLLPDEEPTTPDAVFIELDRLESALGDIEPTDVQGTQIKNRLRTLLSRWETTGTTDRTGDELAEANLEDMFGIIDDEFGFSNGGDAR
ncbi:type I polyketide synthase, partial [Streptomyces mirabilis]|uniref:type I polyketide synthase n=1 Tax=Streptomyces mirabilis TaxID=68239 RepID=UPI00331D50A1